MKQNTTPVKIQQKSTSRVAPSLTVQDRQQRASEFSQMLKARQNEQAPVGGHMPDADHANTDQLQADDRMVDLSIRRTAPDPTLAVGLPPERNASEFAPGVAVVAGTEAATAFASIESISETIWKQWIAQSREFKTRKWLITLHAGDQSVSTIQVEVLETGEWLVGFSEDEDQAWSDSAGRFNSISSLDAEQFCHQLEERMRRRSPGIDLSVKSPLS
jgi:hypothetical protein